MENLPQILDALRQYGPDAAIGIRYAAETYQAIARAFKAKYAEQTPSVQATAIANASDAAHRIGKKVDALVTLGVVLESDVERAMQAPDFAKMLERAILDASETDSELKHEQLALLVAERLKSTPETGKAIAVRMACERIRDLTDKQLRLLGLLFVATNVYPDGDPASEDEDTFARDAAYIEEMLRPFYNVDVPYLDLMQLQGLGLVRVATWARGGARFGHEETPSPAMRHMITKYGMERPWTNAAVQKLNAIMQGKVDGQVPLCAVATLPLGWLIGHSVYAQVTGAPLDIVWA